MLEGTHIKLLVAPNQRKFYVDDKLVMQIDYQDEHDLYSNVHVENFIYHYQIEIKTLRS